MWISIFAIAIAIFLTVAAVMMNVIQQGEANAHQITLLVKAQEASMGKLTPAETVREHNRGKKAAREGRSR
jgi:hypothetical protein